MPKPVDHPEESGRRNPAGESDAAAGHPELPGESDAAPGMSTGQFPAHAELIRVLQRQGIRNSRVLEAMRSVPRHRFVDEDLQAYAYDNHALPIDCDQTISQPYVVARMTEVVLGSASRIGRVMEIGTGSGYQAAVLSFVSDTVYTIERIESLYRKTQDRLQILGFGNVCCRLADGQIGWQDHAPFDGILITAAARSLPKALTEQLAEGGRLVAPLGNNWIGQELIEIHKQGAELIRRKLADVRFVPLRSGVSGR